MSDGKKPRWQVDVVQYTAGQWVIREGEPGDCAYVIQQGEVEVLKRNHLLGEETIIARLGPQEIFGEMCLFEAHPVRSASVRVLSHKAEIMAISKKNFQAQLDAMPAGMRYIVRVLIKRLRAANHQITLLT